MKRGAGKGIEKKEENSTGKEITIEGIETVCKHEIRKVEYIKLGEQ